MSKVSAPASSRDHRRLISVVISRMSRSRRLFLAVPIAAIGAIGLTVLAFKRELSRARDAATRGSSIANTDAGIVEYSEKGAGVPLLSIHGAGGGFDQGLANAADLVGEGFRVISPSRFGYLRTPIPIDASSAAQADAHAALLSRLAVPKAIVIGVSAGARSAVELALRHPERVSALILVVPGTYSPISPVSIDAGGASMLAFWAVNAGADFIWWAAEKLAPSVLVRFVGVPPDLLAGASRADRDRVASVVKNIEPLSLRFAGINVDGADTLRELPLAKIRAPTLIVSARDDLFNTAPAAEFAASKIPNARLVVYASGGHLLVGREGEVRDAVRTFLAGAGLSTSVDAKARGREKRQIT